MIRIIQGGPVEVQGQLNVLKAQGPIKILGITSTQYMSHDCLYVIVETSVISSFTRSGETGEEK